LPAITKTKAKLNKTIDVCRIQISPGEPSTFYVGGFRAKSQTDAGFASRHLARRATNFMLVVSGSRVESTPGWLEDPNDARVDRQPICRFTVQNRLQPKPPE
jgi:hypothetical protein